MTSRSRPTTKPLDRAMNRSKSRPPTKSGARTERRSSSETGNRSSSSIRDNRPPGSVRARSLAVRRSSSSDQLEEHNDPCVCGPDFYTNMLGPTADETILVGLQTFLNFCKECPTNTEEGKHDGDVDVDEDEDELGENGYYGIDKSAQTSAVRNRCSMLQITDDTSLSEGSQTDQPHVQHGLSQTGEMLANYGNQTSHTSLLHAGSQTHHPNMKSGSSQSKYYKNTPTQNKRSSLVHNESQTSISRKSHGKSQGSQKSLVNRSHRQSSKLILKSDTSLSKSTASCTCCQCSGTSGSDETTASAVIENVTCTCTSCKVKTSEKSSAIKSNIKSSLKCKCNVDNITTTSGGCSCASSSQKRQVRVCCDCCTSTSSEGIDSCLCADEDSVKPCQSGDTNEAQVRYAITKITKFFSYTTFEVMKSTKKKPKVMPKSLEGVFVLKNVAT